MANAIVTKKGVTNRIRQKDGEGNFNEVQISYIMPNGCAAEGTGTISSGSDQHVQGRYNIIDENEEFAFIIGNGNEDNRSNAFTVGWDGKAYVQGDLSIGGNIFANGSALEMDKLFGIDGKPDKDKYFLYNHFITTEDADGNSYASMHISPKKESGGTLDNFSATLGEKEAFFADMFLEGFTMMGHGLNDNASKLFESKIQSDREKVHYRFNSKGEKSTEWINALTMTTNIAEENSEQSEEHERFFIKGFFGVGKFDVYDNAYFQSNISISSTNHTGRAILSFGKENDDANGKKYLEISFADTDYEE